MLRIGRNVSEWLQRWRPVRAATNPRVPGSGLIMARPPPAAENLQTRCRDAVHIPATTTSRLEVHIATSDLEGAPAVMKAPRLKALSSFYMLVPLGNPCNPPNRVFFTGSKGSPPVRPPDLFRSRDASIKATLNGPNTLMNGAVHGQPRFIARIGKRLLCAGAITSVP